MIHKVTNCGIINTRVYDKAIFASLNIRKNQAPTVHKMSFDCHVTLLDIRGVEVIPGT